MRSGEVSLITYEANRWLADTVIASRRRRRGDRSRWLNRGRTRDVGRGGGWSILVVLDRRGSCIVRGGRGTSRRGRRIRSRGGRAHGSGVSRRIKESRGDMY
ncbi:unnamed protein product [Linum trigynum]|uniref:Uncharacterized protein n=1 Tax=Linum trigynum TaxID=586398 RepID=A0AAV2DBC4_9ROSI